jgi:hypothetical protein
MSNEKLPVPTKIGWWWRDDVVVYVEEGSRGLLFYEDFSARWVSVEDDGRWVAPVLTPAEADALRTAYETERKVRMEIATHYNEMRDAMRGAH